MSFDKFWLISRRALSLRLLPAVSRNFLSENFLFESASEILNQFLYLGSFYLPAIPKQTELQILKCSWTPLSLWKSKLVIIECFSFGNISIVLVQPANSASELAKWTSNVAELWRSAIRPVHSMNFIHFSSHFVYWSDFVLIILLIELKKPFSSLKFAAQLLKLRAACLLEFGHLNLFT